MPPKPQTACSQNFASDLWFHHPLGRHKNDCSLRYPMQRDEQLHQEMVYWCTPQICVSNNCGRKSILDLVESFPFCRWIERSFNVLQSWIKFPLNVLEYNAPKISCQQILKRRFRRKIRSILILFLINSTQHNVMRIALKRKQFVLSLDFILKVTKIWYQEPDIGRWDQNDKKKPSAAKEQNNETTWHWHEFQKVVPSALA